MLATNILIADDHPLFRTALKQAVGKCLSGVTMLEANSVEELFQTVEQTPELEIVFLDLHMPGNSGFTSLMRLQNHHPDIIVIMVSSDDGPDIMQKAIDFGAAAFIPKSADLSEIAKAINTVLDGETWLPIDLNGTTSTNDKDKKLAKQLAQLTPQQYVVLSRIADGQLNKQIAYDLDIKETTVKKHVSAILQKLEVNNRTMAGMAYQQLALS